MVEDSNVALSFVLPLPTTMDDSFDLFWAMGAAAAMEEVDPDLLDEVTIRMAVHPSSLLDHAGISRARGRSGMHVKCLQYNAFSLGSGRLVLPIDNERGSCFACFAESPATLQTLSSWSISFKLPSQGGK